MALSKRQTILNSIEAILSAISGIGSVGVNIEAEQALSVVMPHVGIYSGPDVDVTDQTGQTSETFAWNIDLVCIVDRKADPEFNDIENFISAVHSAIVSDVTLSGTIDSIKRLGSDPQRAFDLAGVRSSNLLNYQVIYEVNWGEI